DNYVLKTRQTIELIISSSIIQFRYNDLMVEKTIDLSSMEGLQKGIFKVGAYPCVNKADSESDSAEVMLFNVSIMH
ncbi:hypothetical protein HK099_000127, partial [Clydaea vesicula]